MIWVALGCMLFAATLVVGWPLYRRQQRTTLWLGGAVLTILGVPAVIYSQIGTPVPPAAPPSIDAMVASLAARLEANPQDLNGWKMLGRSYVQQKRYEPAERAFQRAAELETGSDPQTLADLGEVVILGANGQLSERATQLFENALAIEPNTPKALFYGGIAAYERGDRELAADRWEALLALTPPPEIQEVLRQRIAEWRGQVPAAPDNPPVITANISLSAAAAAAVRPEATVFIILRDPERPTPPVAAVRRQVSQLPATVPLGDADAMIPGRLPSAFARLEIVARVSMSGQPVAGAGDWYGDRTVTVAESPSVDIVIAEQVK